MFSSSIVIIIIIIIIMILLSFLLRLTFSSSLALPGPVTLGGFTDERGLERAPVRGGTQHLH